HAEFAEGAFRGEGVGEVAEGVLVRIELAILRDLDPPLRDVLAGVVARGQPQGLDHALRRCAVLVDRAVANPKAHWRYLPDGRCFVYRVGGRAYIKYCWLIVLPSELLSVMNSVMNSCRPCWKISSIRLVSSRVWIVRAWRCAGPCRP